MPTCSGVHGNVYRISQYIQDSIPPGTGFFLLRFYPEQRAGLGVRGTHNENDGFRMISTKSFCGRIARCLHPLRVVVEILLYYTTTLVLLPPPVSVTGSAVGLSGIYPKYQCNQSNCLSCCMSFHEPSLGASYRICKAKGRTKRANAAHRVHGKFGANHGMFE